MMKDVPVNLVNEASRFLIPIIFSKDNSSILYSFGFKGVYVDDYGYRSKFENCLFFLFNTKAKFFTEFEKKIANFDSFIDWYDVDENLRMFVFRVNELYHADIQAFKDNRLNELSENYYEVSHPISLVGINVDLSKEIYRFEATNRK